MLSRIPRPRLASLLFGWLTFVLCGNGGGINSATLVLANTLRRKEAGDGSSPTLVTEEVSDHQCWIFTHLQKCGGTTIKAIIHQRWGKRRSIYDSEQWKAGDDKTMQYAKHLLRGRRWEVIAGGYTEGLRPYVGDQCKWFTMFRHPVSRLVSAYFYCRTSPSDMACGSKVVNANNVDLVTFAKHWGNFALRQFALSLVDVGDVIQDAMDTSSAVTDNSKLKNPGWYILKEYLERKGQAFEVSDGRGEELPDRAMYDMLQPTRELLRRNFTAVGILENFDETLELFNRALGMPDLDWQKSFSNQGIGNVDRIYEKEKKKVLVEAWTNAEIKKYIGLDLLLYEHAVAVFNEQKKLHGI